MPTIESQLPVKWHKTWWGLLLITAAAGFFLLAIIAGIYIYTLAHKIAADNAAKIEQQIKQQLFKSGPYQMENPGSPWTGAANPKITIVEFGDFNCPYCRESYSAIREISRLYQNEVRIVFRHYPVTQEDSLDLALASECAHDQKKFWNMHDKFFQTVNPAGQIYQIARQIGLNQSQFEECYAGKKHLDRVKTDVLAAQEVEVKGTPAWFINGNKLEGAIPRETFIQIIAALLDYLNS